MIVLADWKTSTYFGAPFKLQLGGYYGMENVWDKKDQVTYKRQKPQIGLVAQVGPKGVIPKIVMDQQMMEAGKRAFAHAVALYRWLKEAGIEEHEERYTIKGKPYISNTQVLKFILDKPALRQWYYKMGREGKDPTKIRDAKANLGSTIHKNILFYLEGKPVDLTEAPQELQQTVWKFSDWAEKVKLDVLEVESTVFNEEWQAAGTLDCLFRVDPVKFANWIKKYIPQKEGKQT